MTKSITFTLMHFTIAIAVAYAITGSWAAGGAIALIEPLVNSVGYFFHEKFWEARKVRTSRGMTTRTVLA